MQHAILVTEGNALQKLVHEGFDCQKIELAAVAAVHEFLKILVHVFEDQHELILCVYDIM